MSRVSMFVRQLKVGDVLVEGDERVVVLGISPLPGSTWVRIRQAQLGHHADEEDAYCKNVDNNGAVIVERLDLTPAQMVADQLLRFVLDYERLMDGDKYYAEALAELRAVVDPIRPATDTPTFNDLVTAIYKVLDADSAATRDELSALVKRVPK